MEAQALRSCAFRIDGHGGKKHAVACLTKPESIERYETDDEKVPL